jgi:excinuclease ABC subunit A
MSSRAEPGVIRLRGVRQNNLKNFDLDLPLHRLIVVTGLSGSGKSSLAFDTLFAEGQRRYIETFSPYARQFFDRMDKPAVDRIEGIPPAIAIEQRNAVRSTRSTVGTMTEICDHLKLLWPHLAQLHCRQCGQPVHPENPAHVWNWWRAQTERDARTEGLITFDLPLSAKLAPRETLALIAGRGFQRLLVNDTVVRLEAAEPWLGDGRETLTVVQDRVTAKTTRARFLEACEQAFQFGKGRLTLRLRSAGEEFGAARRFSDGLHCARCDIHYREPTPALFSFNHPLGACPNCRGFGRIISIDYQLAIPDRSKTLAGGAVKPWQTETGAECQRDMVKIACQRGVPLNVPFRELSPEHQHWVIEGEPGYQHGDPEHSWPRAWYGVAGYFRWLESKSYKMHVRVLLSRYRAYTRCPTCEGNRLQPESLLYRADGLTLADFYRLTLRDAAAFVDRVAEQRRFAKDDPLAPVLAEVRARLGYLNEVGLGYLTLDRPTRTLSGGETERVNLTSCLGTRLVNTLYVLDEPTVGLHARDSERLVKILRALQQLGNTVVVVEHEPLVIRAADHIVDLGPGHGESGGNVVYAGPSAGIRSSRDSLTGAYLAGRRRIEQRPTRPVDNATPRLRLHGATRNNLRNLDVEIPLGRLVCLTGVSGSGKTTLAREVLLPALLERLSGQTDVVKASNRLGSENEDSADAESAATPADAALSGWESLGRVVLVDQSGLGKTPRSNPAVYIGAFDHIREVFAQSELARQRGLAASAFSFNSAQGQCERCRGAGFEKIEMQFLSDVFIRCPECHGRRYRPHILDVRVDGRRGLMVDGKTRARRKPLSAINSSSPSTAAPAWSIGDLLEATVEDAITFLRGFTDSRPATRAVASLQWLDDVGLGYLRLGQPINTLSGGENQRLKLVSHLAESAQAGAADAKPTLFVFDEPTTGLHFDDVRVLLGVFQRLVEAGHSLLVIEHNLDVIAQADWVIDLGPEAGDDGGRLVVAGTPAQVAACAGSHTGRALSAIFPQVNNRSLSRLAVTETAVAGE